MPGPVCGDGQRRRSGTTGRGPLSKSPDCPLLLDVRGRRDHPSGRARRERVGVTGSRPARVRKSSLAATSRRPEQRQLLQHVQRPRQHLRPRRDGAERRRRRARPAAAALDQRHRRESGDQHDGLDVSGQDDSALAPCEARTGSPTMCSMATASAWASSLQPLARAVATRCGTALEPSRSSDDAPPWQRGPAGRRQAEAIRGERREDDMGEAFGHRARATSGCRAPRVSRASAWNVPAVGRDPRHGAPGAGPPPRRRALTRGAARRRLASQSQAGVTAGASSS